MCCITFLWQTGPTPLDYTLSRTSSLASYFFNANNAASTVQASSIAQASNIAQASESPTPGIILVFA